MWFLHKQRVVYPHNVRFIYKHDGWLQNYDPRADDLLPCFQNPLYPRRGSQNQSEGKVRSHAWNDHSINFRIGHSYLSGGKRGKREPMSSAKHKQSITVVLRRPFFSSEWRRKGNSTGFLSTSFVWVVTQPPCHHDFKMFTCQIRGSAVTARKSSSRGIQVRLPFRTCMSQLAPSASKQQLIVDCPIRPVPDD